MKTRTEIQERIRGMVKQYAKAAQDPVSADEKELLRKALAEADEHWEVDLSAGNTGFVLSWNAYGYPVEPDDQLTSESVRNLAEAIAVLEKYGFRVRLGRSARGYTYLNIDTE